MKKCYEYVAKKFGDDYAQEIMQTTPENIINGQKLLCISLEVSAIYAKH